MKFEKKPMKEELDELMGELRFVQPFRVEAWWKKLTDKQKLAIYHMHGKR